MDEGWSLLIEAIIAQAIQDYAIGLKTNNKRFITDCESFFNSQWYEFLCDIEGDFYIQLVRKRVKEKKKCIPRKKLVN